MSRKLNAKDLGNNSEEDLLRIKWKTLKWFWEGEGIKKKRSYCRLPGSLINFVFCIVNLINIIPFEVQHFTWKKNILTIDLKKREEGRN